MLFDDGLYIERPVSDDPEIARALSELIPISACLESAVEPKATEELLPNGPDPRMVAAIIDRREGAARLVHKLLYGPVPSFKES